MKNWKQAWSHFRMLIAEWLIGFAMTLAPKNEEGDTLRLWVYYYMQGKIKGQNTDESGE